MLTNCDLAKELAAIGNDCSSDHEHRVEAGCRALGLLGEGESASNVVEVYPWRRGGAESYVCAGEIVIRRTNMTVYQRTVVAKAYAGFGLGASIERKIEEWEQRAEALSRAGCDTCTVYGKYRGALFVEYLPWSVPEYLGLDLDSSYPERLVTHISTLAERLDTLRARPVSVLPDLRTDGNRIAIVDFGEDLGPIPGHSLERHYCRSLLAKELEQLGLAVPIQSF